MKHRASKVLYDYWNEVRGDRRAPRRLEIEPARIAGILPESFILERVDLRSYRFRLAGTKICEYFGTEFRGQNYLDAWNAEDRAVLTAHLAIVAEQAAIALVEFEAWGAGRSVVFEALFVPVVQSGSAVDRLLGTMSPQDLPDWLGTERLTKRTLLRHELVWPQRAPVMLPAAPHEESFTVHVRDGRLVRDDRRQFRVYDGGLTLTEKHDNS